MPSFVNRLDAPLEMAGLGALKVDIAYGGDSFVIVDAAGLGFAVQPDEARDLEEMGIRTIAAANEQLGFFHPEAGGWDQLSFCQFAGPLTREGSELHGPNASVIRPGKIDRSPTETGCSARMAFLSARADGRGRRLSRPLDHRVGVCLSDHAADHDRGRPAIIPAVSGRAWITDVSQYMLDPADPWPSVYWFSDTWPRIGEAI